MHHPAALRAQLLAEQGRFEQAIEELRRALLEQPEHGPHHALLGQLLALTGQYDEAEREAAHGITLAPDEPWCHYAMGRVLLERRRWSEAERALRQAIALEPGLPDFHAGLGQSLLAQKRWADALQALDTGLQFDPEHADCRNLRSVALTRLGRAAEATDTLDSALARDPENAHTHLARGWALLHRGEVAPAIEHFREALRLDASLDSARAGLVEALKARNPVYRVVLRWFLFLERFSAGRQFTILAGAWLLHLLVQRLTESTPELEWLQTPAMVVYLSLVVLSWGAVPFFNLLLLLHPLGRRALPPHERNGGLLIGCVLLLVLTGLALHWSGVDAGFLVAMFGGFLFLPAAAAAVAPPGRGRLLFLLLVLGLVVWFASWLWRVEHAPPVPVSTPGESAFSTGRPDAGREAVDALLAEWRTLLLTCALSSWGAVFLGVFGQNRRPR